MTIDVTEWLNLALRWLHLTAGLVVLLRLA